MQKTLKDYYKSMPLKIYSRVFNIAYFIYTLYPFYIFLNFFRYFGRDISLNSFIFTRLLGRGVKIMGGVFMDSASSLGEYSYIAGDNFGLNSTKIYATIIGRYCSIAQNFVTLPAGHNYKYVSTFPFATSSQTKKKLTAVVKPIVIHDGVWIGSNVVLLGGVTIGVGSVIGAGSIVTKNVDAYTVVAGNPARVIKKRFSDKQIEKLLQIDLYNSAEKIDVEDFLSEDIDNFLKKYQHIAIKK